MATQLLPWIVFTTLAILVGQKLIAYAAAKRRVSYLPGQRPLFASTHPLGALLPTCWFHPGLSWQWGWRHQVYERYGCETISQVGLLAGGPTLYTSSLEVAKLVVSTKGPFRKSPESTALMKIWGPNVLTENGAEWRRHRRILAPAFTNKTYSLVCQETCSTYHELCSAEGWNDKNVVEIPSTSPITSKFAMILISRCGFGSPIEWAFDKNTNGEMNFATALATVSSSLLPRFVLPKWLYSLPFRKLREVDTAYTVAETFMQDLIASRRREMQLGLDDDRSDVLSLMLRASVAEGKLGMKDEELMGNTFLLLFAGHETTAQTMNAVLGLLALHPDIQHEVYEQIRETIPDNLSPTFENLQKLFKLEACFIGAARLFPAVLMFSRETAEDAILPIYDANGILSQIAVPAGTEVIVDNIGMLYNPRHFPEPDVFRPSRWYNSHDNDFAMFSVGSRTCIGKRFAITEATTFLTLLLRD